MADNKKEEVPMLDCVVLCLRVVPQYNFIVTVIAVAISIYWALAKLRQWRLEGIRRRRGRSRKFALLVFAYNFSENLAMAEGTSLLASLCPRVNPV